MKIHKGDQVVVLSGKDKGKRGEVLRAFPKTGQRADRGCPPRQAFPEDNPDPKAGRDHRQGSAGAHLDRVIDLFEGTHSVPRYVQVFRRRYEAAGLCALW